MNAAQRRQVDELKRQLMEAAAERAREFSQTDPSRMSDALLERKAAARNGWLLDLGTGPFVPEVTEDMMIEAVRRRRAEAAGLTYEAYLELSDEERRELFPQREAPVSRPEFRWSDGKEAQ